MIVRPAMAALSCRRCQHSLFRSGWIAGRHYSITSSAPRLRTQPNTLLEAQRCSLSTSRRLQNEGLEEKVPVDGGDVIEAMEVGDDEAKEIGDDEAKEIDNEETPWFLDEEPPQKFSSQLEQTRPVAPVDAPPVLEPTLQYVFEDMGLDDMSLFDLRDLTPQASLGPNLIMAFGTARSEKHLHIAASRLVRWLRKQHGINARGDGIIGAGELRTKMRRLRKKAKLAGTNSNIIPAGDNGISTGWVCVSFNSEDEAKLAAAAATPKFDSSGRVSGFDATAVGNTIVVQCMTEARRQELDLETLWRGVLRRSLEESRVIENKEPYSIGELEAQIKARVQMPAGANFHTTSAQWEALESASKRRFFSTCARRLDTFSKRLLREATTTTTHLSLDSVGDFVRDVQVTHDPVDCVDFCMIFWQIFQASPHGPKTVPTRLEYVEQLLQLAEERSITVMSNPILVSLIEAVVASPSYGPALQRAQANLEVLLMESNLDISMDDLNRLLSVYAARRDWPRVWETMRMPTRYGWPRDASFFTASFSKVAATGDVAACTDVLRNFYPALAGERPPIKMTDALYDAVRACVGVADPFAEGMLRRAKTLARDEMGDIENRQLQCREFVILLNDLELEREKMLSVKGTRMQDELASEIISDHARI